METKNTTKRQDLQAFKWGPIIWFLLAAAVVIAGAFLLKT